ncbi:MAG: glycoside hydrolase family 2 protein, partial [Verrucomicrobia bacterium]
MKRLETDHPPRRRNAARTLALTSILLASTAFAMSRTVIDFNHDWKFHLGNEPAAFLPEYNDREWRTLDVPHDWSIEIGYQQGPHTAASTGFVPGGIGWYRKHFTLSPEDRDRHIRIVFDGVYNNASVWINGHFLGKRPYAYSTFDYTLDGHLRFDGTPNVIAVKVDHRHFADSRWYTGSGIYRKVRLIKTAPIHIALHGVRITTPEVNADRATVRVRARIENTGNLAPEQLRLRLSVTGPDGEPAGTAGTILSGPFDTEADLSLPVRNPRLWSPDTPHLYRLRVELLERGHPIDTVEETFGIRTFHFDAATGFSLNGRRMKIKGVNLHHDAGAVGAAVPKALWIDRLQRLKSIGVNAVRMAHNPHAVELMDACDELGMLVLAEAFDEWDRPKDKSLEYLGDGKATDLLAGYAYPEHFHEWAERDLKDLIRRDFNHPSVILWSIGNEIEWTFPEYSKVFDAFTHPEGPYDDGEFEYDRTKLKAELDRITGGCDALTAWARRLAGWIREIDDTRPITCGSVRPSVSIASGYADAVDVFGFNYRASEYDIAHQTYPELKILGTENWGAWSEWKACLERDFVAGIFVWTGFAYLGEAGPWPRKGLEISFFDFAGFKTPRGHFFECLWTDTPKVHIVTTPASESEYSYSPDTGWTFTMKKTPPPMWDLLRYWDWYDVYPKWQYTAGEPIVVQVYTNCEEVELFLNGRSLGRQARADFADDNIIKWLVPYADGELTAIGYNAGEKAETFTLATHGETARLALASTRETLAADGEDAAVISLQLLDAAGHLVTTAETEVRFEIDGPARNLGVDNGWEYNVQPHKTDTLTTH